MDHTDAPLGRDTAPEPSAVSGLDAVPDGLPTAQEAPELMDEQREAIHARNAWIRAADRALTDMRQRSYEGKLTTTSRWAKLAFAPEGEDRGEFQESLLSYIEDHEHATDEPAMGELKAPTPLEVQLAGRELSEDDPLPEPDTSDVVPLYGKKAVYLYSKPLMSHSFAHALFNTMEHDDLATFVDVVRSESRDYPRPVAASIFMNPPYLWSVDKTVDLFERTIDDPDLADICITKTSAGESYFYSRKYLSDAQGKALAEWYGVEKGRNP